MFTTSWTSLQCHKASNRSTVMQNICKAYFPLPHVRRVTDSYNEIQRLKILLGEPIGIEPAHPAFQASLLTTTAQHHGTKFIKFTSSNHIWQMVLQHVVITTVLSYYESTTYIAVQSLLSWSADKQDKEIHMELGLC